jgi:hypothetical protein
MPLILRHLEVKQATPNWKYLNKILCGSTKLNLIKINQVVWGSYLEWTDVMKLTGGVEMQQTVWNSSLVLIKLYSGVHMEGVKCLFSSVYRWRIWERGHLKTNKKYRDVIYRWQCNHTLCEINVFRPCI